MEILEKKPKVEELSTLGLIMQFLHEHNYLEAFEKLQEESGEKFDTDVLRLGGQLETILLLHEERTLAHEISQMHFQERDTQTKLMERGDGNYVKATKDSMDKIHPSNILCVSFKKDEDSKLLASGSTDKTIKITNYETHEVVKQLSVHNGAVIAMDFNPKFKNLLVTGAMDGTHAVVDTESGKTIQSFSDHLKYVVGVAWHPEGKMFATASHDHTANLYKSDENGDSYHLVQKFHFTNNVETLAFSKKGTLLIGARDDNYLHLVDLNTMKDERFNMNAAKDDHVSFTPLDVSFSPDDEFILVSTDRDRLIMYHVGNSNPVRNFWGCNNDLYSQPRHAWHPSGKYVYSTSQDHKIYCWEVATQNIVHKLEGHKSTVRDIQVHPFSNMLASCSFDKTIKLWD